MCVCIYICVYMCCRYIGGTRFIPLFAGFHTVLLPSRDQVEVQKGNTIGLTWRSKMIYSTRFFVTPRTTNNNEEVFLQSYWKF